jgi:amino-acid N-acetyltransferase
MTTVDGAGRAEVVVERVGPTEWADVARLVSASGLPLEGMTEAWLALAARPVHGGAPPVGVVALERHGEGAEVAFLLRSAAVEPAWQGRGVADQLVRAALQVADQENAPVGLLTETAADYFPRFGFTPVSWVELPASLGASSELRGACPSTATAMLRSSRDPVRDAAGSAAAGSGRRT